VALLEEEIQIHHETRIVLYCSWISTLFEDSGRLPWPRGLRHMCVATCLLGLWVPILSSTWMLVACECCLLSGRGLCDGLITCPEESYRLWCIIVCDLETSRRRRPWPLLGHSTMGGGGKSEREREREKFTSCGYDAVMLARFFLTFRRNRWPSSSGPSSPRTAMQKQDKDSSDPRRL
jgi:hypothetical protein